MFLPHNKQNTLAMLTKFWETEIHIKPAADIRKIINTNLVIQLFVFEYMTFYLQGHSKSLKNILSQMTWPLNENQTYQHTKSFQN